MLFYIKLLPLYFIMKNMFLVLDAESEYPYLLSSDGEMIEVQTPAIALRTIRHLLAQEKITTANALELSDVIDSWSEAVVIIDDFCSYGQEQVSDVFSDELAKQRYPHLN